MPAMNLPMPADLLLPQKPPFQLVDTLLSANTELTVTSFVVPEDHMMVHNGKLTEGGVLEHMAQSAAAGAGYQLLVQDKPVPVGYIGAIKNMQMLNLPSTGSILETQIYSRHQLGHASIVAAETRSGSALIASCEFTIFVS